MLFAAALLLAAGGPHPRAARADTTAPTYSSAALETLVARADSANRVPPPDLRGYRAHVETELSLIIRDTLGREQTGEVEQVANEARWSRSGDYEMHMTGYRARTVGVPYSSLSLVRAWTTPTLYGDRLNVGVYFRESPRARLVRGDTVVAVHPFAADRDRYYTFTGGDTVSVLHTGGRAIAIVRIMVQPHFRGATAFAAFDGEIDVDAERAQIVRMRGQFVTLRKPTHGHGSLVQRPGFIAVAYVEFVNGEVDGRYWLPSFQRTEFQASVALLGQTRPVFRLLSTFSGYDVSSDSTQRLALDSLPRLRVITTSAPHDSLDAFQDWQRDLGVATASVHADDFQDVAPDAWRPSGAPRLDLWPHGFYEMFRFNRVEGLYVGSSATLYLRDALPGASVGVFGGWATAEHTARGGFRAGLQRLPWMAAARAARELPTTNDFTPPLGRDPGIAALLSSVDDADYLDRRTVAMSLTRILGAVDRGLLTGELALAHDGPEQARIRRGVWLNAGQGFRANRNVVPGSYARASFDAEMHPNVSGESLNGGVGGDLHYEAAAGALHWQRAELNLSARHTRGAVTLVAHADAGAVLSSTIPPQELFELGGNETLPAYDYKQFVGDRAALFRLLASYRFPVLRRPVHVFRGLFLPAISPALAASGQGGWTQLSSAAARSSAAELSPVGGPPLDLSATGSVRSSAGVGFTLFSDAFHFGVARPLDHPAPWRFIAGFGAAF